MKTIFDPTFRYSASFNTDLRKTFARIRRAQRVAVEKAVPTPVKIAGNVSPIARRSAGR